MIDTNTTEIAIPLKYVLDFLTTNKGSIVFVLFLFLFRSPLSNLITRITKFRYKSKESEVGIDAIHPEVKHGDQLIQQGAFEQEPAATENTETKAIEIATQQRGWFGEMHKAIGESRLQDAEDIFNKYSASETNLETRARNRAFYLFLLYDKTRSNSLIDQLEDLLKSAKSDQSRFDVATWLSVALREEKRKKRDIELWEQIASQVKAAHVFVQANIELAHALSRNEQGKEARLKLVDILRSNDIDEFKHEVYEALAQTEKELGNKSLAVLCDDKSVEYRPTNTESLFRSAFNAAEEGLKDISIANYTSLLDIDKDHEAALNNIGVHAQEADLKVEAVEYYQRSSELNNTLATANQGYLLLDAGYANEAEKLAKAALQQENTHENIFRLITAINEKRKIEKEKWSEIGKKAASRQSKLRKYVEQYYLGETRDLEGDWITGDGTKLTLSITNGAVFGEWTEQNIFLGAIATPDKDSAIYQVTLSGKVSGSTFKGFYRKKRAPDQQPRSNLGFGLGDKSIECWALLSDDKFDLYLIPEDYKNDFSLTIRR